MPNERKLQSEVVLNPQESLDFRVQFLSRAVRLARLRDSYENPRTRKAIDRLLVRAIDECLYIGLKPADIRIMMSGSWSQKAS